MQGAIYCFLFLFFVFFLSACAIAWEIGALSITWKKLCYSIDLFYHSCAMQQANNDYDHVDEQTSYDVGTLVLLLTYGFFKDSKI